MLPVKNEAWTLRHCLKSLSFCDEILVVNDGSTDSTLSILEEFRCSVLPFNTQSLVGWKEYEIRSFLLTEARKRHATHLVAIDGDEMFSDAFVRDAKSILKSLPKGETLSLPWLNVVDITHIYAPIVNKPFIMHDDSTSAFREAFMHVPRVPSYTPNVIGTEPHAVLHFQYLNEERTAYKQAWYMMSEKVKSSRHPIRINAMYKRINLKEISYPVGSLIYQPLPDPSTDRGVWQKEAIEAMLNDRGVLFFETLDIWHIPELLQRFISETGRKPRPFLIPMWLLTLNDWKNRIKNILN